MGRFCATCGTYLSQADAKCACEGKEKLGAAATEPASNLSATTQRDESLSRLESGNKLLPSSADSNESGLFVAEVAEPFGSPVTGRDSDAEVIILEAADVVSTPLPQPAGVSQSPSAYEVDARNQANVNQGSPFLPVGANRPTVSTSSFASVDRYAARGGAIGSLLAGSIALIGGVFCSGSAIVGLVGIAFVATLGIIAGFWGLLSEFRRRSVAGVLISALAIILVFAKPFLELFQSAL